MTWMAKIMSDDYQASYFLFIPYFGLLVFGILVTLVMWFSFRVFFRLALPCLGNKDYVIFSYFCNFADKSDQKWKMKWTKHLANRDVINFSNLREPDSNWLSFSVSVLFSELLNSRGRGEISSALPLATFLANRQFLLGNIHVWGGGLRGHAYVIIVWKKCWIICIFFFKARGNHYNLFSTVWYI